MSQEFERFATHLKVSDRLIEQASKEDMAETARVLASVRSDRNFYSLRSMSRTLIGSPNLGSRRSMRSNPKPGASSSAILLLAFPRHCRFESAGAHCRRS